MPKNIDAIFTTEQLRKNWALPSIRKDKSVPVEREVKEPWGTFAALGRNIKDRFSGDDLATLTMLINELHPIMNLLFPDEGDINNKPASDPAELLPVAHDILNRLEDLVESFELRSGARQG